MKNDTCTRKYATNSCPSICKQVLKQNGNLLMLDEPTNDADVDLLRALESAILAWPGTVLCISHGQCASTR